MSDVRLREADAADAAAVASLHADSWRRHYRGAYADAFLDGDVDFDRLRVWQCRLGSATVDSCTVVAETDGRVVGFAHTVLDADPIWGALLDNLHVAADQHRRGIGRRLIARSAAFVAGQRPGSALFLWVLEQNVDAQRFYAAIGGRPAGTAPVPPVGGVAGRVNGTPAALRYVWADPRLLVPGAAGPPVGSP